MNLDATHHVQLVDPIQSSVKLTLRPNTGLFHGSFLPPGATRAAKFSGAVLQKQRLGAGFFLTGEASGAVTLTPRR